MARRRDLGPGLDGDTGDGTGGNGNDGKGGKPPRVSGTDVQASTIAEQGRPLPIAYGTVKAQALLIERAEVETVEIPSRAASTFYSVGDYRINQRAYQVDYYSGGSPTGSTSDVVTNGPRVYKCKAAGTSAAIIGGVNPKGTSTTDVYDGGNFGPVGTAQTIADGTAVWEYVQELPFQLYEQHFIAAICEGESQGATGMLWWDKETIANEGPEAPGHALAARLGPDAANQTIPLPFDQSGYQHTSVIFPGGEPTLGAPTGTQRDLPEIALEWQGVMFGSLIRDVSPADVLADLVTHSRRGCGLSSSRIDTSITGTGADSMRVYCDAIGFRFSWLIDTQRSALSLIADILRATNCEAIWSGGKLKVIPLGDQSITSPVYGSTNYVPSATSQYTLTTDDFLDAEHPVMVEHTPDADTFNSVPVEYVDRGNSFHSTTTVEAASATDVQKRGLQRAGTVVLPMTYPSGEAPTTLSKILRKRNLKVRNRYTFRLHWRYVGLEPTDLVELSLAELGPTPIPVRITRTQRAADRTITVTAEDYPAHVSHAAKHTPQAGDGYLANDVRTVSQLPQSVDSVRMGVSPKAIPYSGLSGVDFDNLWPNPNSENDPPAGISVNDDGSQPEWDYRVQAGAGVAYAGSWVREFSGPTLGVTRFGITVPCSPGEIFYISAYARRTAGAGNCQLGIDFLDEDGVSTLGIPYLSGISAPVVWTKDSVRQAEAPADSVTAYLFLEVQQLTTFQWDAIYARRMVDLALLADDAAASGDLLTWGGTGWAPASPFSLATIAYSATVTPNAALGNAFVVTATNGSAFTVADPLNPSTGQRLVLRIRNTSGGALGAITWGGAFKMAAWTSPATGNSRTIEFQYDGTNWIEIGRTPSDVPN